jgi:hypothetical protein
MIDFCKNGISSGAPGSNVTCPNRLFQPYIKENNTTAKHTKKVERNINLIKKMNVPRTTPETFIPIVAGAKKKSISVATFADHRSAPRLSNIHWPKNRVRVTSGKTKVISWINKYIPSQNNAPNIDS